MFYFTWSKAWNLLYLEGQILNGFREHLIQKLDFIALICFWRNLGTNGDQQWSWKWSVFWFGSSPKRMRSIIFFTLVVAISTFGGRGGVCKKCTTSVVYITTASLPLVHSQRQIDNNIVLINTTVLGSSASWYRTTANLPSNSFKTSSSILTTPTLFKKKDYIQWNECTCDFLCQRSASHHLTHSSYSALFMKHLLF